MPVASEIETVLVDLAETPRRLAALIQGRDDSRLRFRPAGEPWSACDILAHPRACADVWGRGLLAMIEQDHPTLRYVSPRTWVRKTHYPHLAFRESLAAFTLQRDDLLCSLQALPAAAWSRGATVATTTRGREQTVLSYARRIARHEREHLAQIAAILKTR